MPKVIQPPVSAVARDREEHAFGPVAVALVASVVLLGLGVINTTRVATTEGPSASEAQLVKAIASGGLHASRAVTVQDPAKFQDPSQAAAALARMAREEATLYPIKYKVNTGAADPCPT
jgi:hypothetical protein